MILDLQQDQRNKEIEEHHTIKPLTDADKKSIFGAIRFSFMTHDELLKLMQNPDFILAKDMIMQGLSCKLNNYEVSAGTDLLINLRPRDVTQAQMEKDQQLAAQDPLLAPGQGINPMKTYTQQDAEKRVQDGTMPTQSTGQNFAKTMNPYTKPN